MNRRPGYSLIEVIVVMVTASTMMAVTVALLYGLLRAERGTRDHIRHSTALGRLADQFRRDVHAAVAPPAAEERGWRLVLAPGETVVYRAEPGRMDRLRKTGENLQQRESFALPPGTTATIETSSAGDIRTAGLLIAPNGAEPKRSSAQPIRFDAVVGRDRRFVTVENQ